MNLVHPDMRVAFYVSMVTFLLLYATIYWLRVHTANRADELVELELEVDDKLAEVRELGGAKG